MSSADINAIGGNGNPGVSATVRVNTLEVALTVPTSVTVGSIFQVRALVGNAGPTNILEVSAVLNGGAIQVLGNVERQFGRILPFQNKEVKWNLVAEDAGNYIILVTVTGIEEVSGELLETQDTALVEVS